MQDPSKTNQELLEEISFLKERIKGFEQSEEMRKQAEAAVRKSEAKFKEMFETIEDLYYELDAEGIIRLLSPSVLRLTGWNEKELIGKPAVSVYSDPHDREQMLLKLSEKGYLHDYGLLLKRKDGKERQISLSAHLVRDDNGRPIGVRGLLRDITERKQTEETLKQTLEKLRKSLGGTIRAMSLTVETRDPYTAGHQTRVSNLARAISQEMGLPNDTVDTIRMAGSIHDMGKLSVPSEILSKPGKLTKIEFSLIKIHPQSGYDILKGAQLPYPIAEIVLQHHEKLDGSGYPLGLKDGQILLESRIVSVADVVEAMASHRPYRPALGIEVALKEIEKNKGVFYDAGVVEVCLKVFRKNVFKFE